MDTKINSMLRMMVASALLLGAFGISQQAVAGIAATKHNLSASGLGAGNDNYNTNVDEICVFCHTPHGSNTNVTAPLWNKPVNGGAYTTYTTATSASINGAVDMTGISLACLSCHDGTQAMDMAINKPGSGGWIDGTTGARMDAAGAGWVGAAADGKMPAGIAMLGTDLTNDHPVGIQYCGGGINTGADSTGAAAGTCNDTDFKTLANDLKASKIDGTNQVFWVETGGNATRSKTDLPLYSRVVGGSFQPYVECASCHDPHSDTNATFLRISNTGSAVCLSCHVK